MAALRENRSYGLSGKLSRGQNVSVFHVKLTDSAATAIDCFRNGEVIFLCLFSFAVVQRAKRSRFAAVGHSTDGCCGAEPVVV